MTISNLIYEYAAFLQMNEHLPTLSADEMLLEMHDELSYNQITWLENYIERWDEAQENGE